MTSPLRLPLAGCVGDSERPLRRRLGCVRGVCVSLLLALTPHDSAAQTYQGGVRGAVRDPGGVVPGADVALVNEATAVERTTITNAVGEYAFPNVAPGVYTLRAALSGFKTFESRGLIVGTQEFLTLDLPLEVGEVRETIVVTGGSPVIDATTASVGHLIERRTLETLPNVGRNPFVISTITANVIPTGVPQFTRMQDQNATAMLSLGGGPPTEGAKDLLKRLTDGSAERKTALSAVEKTELAALTTMAATLTR